MIKLMETGGGQYFGPNKRQQMGVKKRQYRPMHERYKKTIGQKQYSLRKTLGLNRSTAIAYNYIEVKGWQCMYMGAGEKQIVGARGRQCICKNFVDP